MKKRENIIFFVLVLAIFVFGVLAFVKPEKLVSGSENRSLTTFSHFAIDAFLDGTFQDNFENAISDQFVFSEKIRVAYRKMLNSAPSFGLEEQVCKNHYLELSNNSDHHRATFNCDDYMVYYPEPLIGEDAETVAENIQKYNRINSLTDAYYYFIEDSGVYDFENDKKIVDYYSILSSNLTGKYHLSGLFFDSYDEYKKYFYKTDHHWDYRGSYQGYQDIVKLLGAGTPLKPTGTGTNHEYFFGSMARSAKNYDTKEEFVYYTFDIPSYSTLVDGAPSTYGHYDDYVNHNYEYDKDANYYGYFYGGDDAEVIFNFHNPEKQNLLMIVNSYSNPINKLIASHFNKTYIVDLRSYETVFGKKFDLDSYLKENDIDKTLLIMSPTFIRNRITNQGLEF